MTVTIISGASRGIGKAIADDLKDNGHKFILLSSYIIDFENYKNVFWKVTDLLDSIDAEQINVILCAAQIGTANELSLIEADKLYKINVLGNMAVIKAVIAKGVKTRIVWFAGGGAAFAYPEFFGYSLSKVAVVRAVENLAVSGLLGKDSSIIALAPGAVETDMLKIVTDAGCKIRTKTKISEPVNFVRKFILDEFDSVSLNGKFLHVRDTLNIKDKDIFQLRRIE
jgi:NAD(P)-dependent dehydrogenase (short-subunit alcohol dehydrogenase family)